MPTKTQTTTTTDSPLPNEHDSPAVLAYRVGQLETAVKEGITTLTDKLDKLSNLFTPLEEFNKLEKRVLNLENKDNLKQTLLWVGLVASAIINIVGAAKLFNIL